MIELRHYRAFLALAQELHFGRAARRLGIAQPPLSRCIRDLEDSLGTTLFLRSPREVKLTPEGFHLLLQVEEALRSFDRIENSVRALRGGRVLRVGFLSNLGYLALPRALDELRRTHPEARVDVFEMSSSEQERALRSMAIDVALTSPPVLDQELMVRPLFEEPLMAILPRRHRLAARPALAPEDLADEPFIVCPQYRKSGFQEVINAICRSAGFEPKIRHEIESKPILADMIATGSGVSVVPASSQRFGTDGVVYRPLSGKRWTIACVGVWQRASRHPLRKRFLDEIVVQGRRLAEAASVPAQPLRSSQRVALQGGADEVHDLRA